MKYLESYSESKITIDDIKNLFVEFSSGVNINTGFYTISVSKMKNSNIEFYRNNYYNSNQAAEIMKSIDFTDYENKPKFEVLVKSSLKLDKKVFNSSYKAFDIIDIYDELKQIEEYLLTTDISIKFIQIVHVIKLPKEYSSTYGSVTSMFSEKASYLQSSINYGDALVSYNDVSIVDKIKPVVNVKSIKFLIF
jgi:hypothetical protein